MTGFPSPFGESQGEDEDVFADEEEFEEQYIPNPGPFLEGHRILRGDAHIEFHELTADIFEQRGVYDMTFGYNLAKLNADTRHPEAGFRYAEQAGDDAVLRVEFTPTTAFCPQGDTLTKGAFRAWNGLDDAHEYEIVRVRVADTHQQSDVINEDLEELEAQYRETGTVAEEMEADTETQGAPF